ncbi:MAG: glycyl-radical enzyme activating protein [Eubacteriales bacterium]|nr:glycyl-radical enzyme activating protein [Eubacteriales bacterium]
MQRTNDGSAMIFDVQHNSFVDGPGIRTTVFFKGCNLRCQWCHNPESQAMEPQLLFDAEKCTGCGKCREVCPQHLKSCTLCGQCALYCPGDARSLCGEKISVQALLEQIEQDRAYYEASGGGVTFSGGECLLQPGALGALLRGCRERGISTAVDTAGAVSWETLEAILPDTDLFLYDIKCISNGRHRQFTGAGNAVILQNYQRLLSAGKAVWVRVPLVEGFNTDEEELAALCAFLRAHPPQRVEALPYHRLGERKYRALGADMAQHTFPVMEQERAEELKKRFREST